MDTLGVRITLLKEILSTDHNYICRAIQSTKCRTLTKIYPKHQFNTSYTSEGLTSSIEYKIPLVLVNYF